MKGKIDNLKNHILIQQVISKHVNLNQKGKEYSGLCPFHEEKTPSFKVNVEKKIYHCFGCGAHGDVINFIAQISNIKYMQAARILAKEYGLEFELKESAVIDRKNHIMENLRDYFITTLNDNLHAKKYLLNRGITSDTITTFQVGYSDGKYIKYLIDKNHDLKELKDFSLITEDTHYPIFRKRIMFPIHDYYGNIVGLGARTLNPDVKPKYLNSKENDLFKKREILYNENLAVSYASQSNSMIVVEGYTDCMIMYQFGFRNTVATLGTAINIEQIKKIWSYVDEVILCLDPDIAGRNAVKKIVKKILPCITTKKFLSFIDLPKNYDPDDYLSKFGASKFQVLIEKRKKVSTMIYELCTMDHPLDYPEDYAVLSQKLIDTISSIEDKQLFFAYKRAFADRIWKLQNIKTNVKSVKSIVLEKLKFTEPINFNDILEIENFIIAILFHDFKILDYYSELKEYFYEINFSTQNLSNLQKYLLDKTDENKDKCRESISNIQNVITNRLIPQLNNCNIAVLWKFIVNQHQIISLQKLHDEIIINGGNTTIANNYLKQIFSKKLYLKKIMLDFNKKK